MAGSRGGTKTRTSAATAAVGQCRDLTPRLQALLPQPSPGCFHKDAPCIVEFVKGTAAFVSRIAEPAGSASYLVRPFEEHRAQCAVQSGAIGRLPFSGTPGQEHRLCRFEESRVGLPPGVMEPSGPLFFESHPNRLQQRVRLPVPRVAGRYRLPLAGPSGEPSGDKAAEQRRAGCKRRNSPLRVSGVRI